MRFVGLLISAAILAHPVLAQTPPPEQPPPATDAQQPTPSPEPPPPEPTPTPTPPPPPPPAPPPAPPPTPPPPPASDWKSRLFFGGGVGASFGDVDYVEVSPLVGFRVTNRLSTGVGVFYRWKNDDRFNSSVDTQDWGASLFGRLVLFRGIFAHAEYEYVDYEYLTVTGTGSDTDTNVLGGLGFSRGAGRAGFYALALYNFSYDEDDLLEPYDSPWIYRVGVSVGF